MSRMVLILLPGMDGTGKLFESFVTALAGQLETRVVRYPTGKSLDYQELEQVVRASIPSHGSVILLGESFSGPIAVSLAASLGDRVAGLVLCCSFVRNPLPALSRLRGLIDAMPVSRIPVGALSYFLLGRFSSGALRAALAASLADVASEVMRARMRAVLTVDVSDKLRQIHVPLLYLQAVHDRVMPRAAGELVMRLAPHAQLVKFDAPHFLLQAVPHEAAGVVTNFAAQVMSECA